MYTTYLSVSVPFGSAQFSVWLASMRPTHRLSSRSATQPHSIHAKAVNFLLDLNVAKSPNTTCQSHSINVDIVCVCVWYMLESSNQPSAVYSRQQNRWQRTAGNCTGRIFIQSVAGNRIQSKQCRMTRIHSRAGRMKS